MPDLQGDPVALAPDQTWHAIADVLPFAICLVDEYGVIAAVNRAWRRFATCNAGDVALVCEGADYLAVCHQAAERGCHAAGQFATGLAAVLDGELAAFELLYDCHSPDEERWFVSRTAPVMLAGRRQVVVVHENVTARHRAEASTVFQRSELAAANDRLREVDILKDMFLGMVSHELRTPLTGIQGYAELLQDEVANLPGLAGVYATELLGQTARMRRLVDDLLDFLKLRSGTFSVLRERADLADVLRELVPALTEHARAAGLTLVATLPDGPVWASVDARRIEQVLWNLVGNAAKHTPRGGRIDLELLANPRWAEVSVADTGSGIPAAERARLFEPFAQLEGGAGGGVGLGLAITKSLIAQHGGDIWVTSEPGHGSRFTFQLPLITPVDP